MFAARGPRYPGVGPSLFWPLGIVLGAAAILLILLISPRPFFATIAVILWLVALLAANALLQWREGTASDASLARIAWRVAGALYLVGAAILIADPLLGNVLLVTTLAASLGLAGAARLTLALESGRRGGLGLSLSASVTLAVALAIALSPRLAPVGPVIMALALDLLILGAAIIFWRTGDEP